MAHNDPPQARRTCFLPGSSEAHGHKGADQVPNKVGGEPEGRSPSRTLGISPGLGEEDAEEPGRNQILIRGSRQLHPCSPELHHSSHQIGYPHYQSMEHPSSARPEQVVRSQALLCLRFWVLNCWWWPRCSFFLISPTALFFVLREIFVAVGGIKGQMLSKGVWLESLAMQKRLHTT